MTTNIIGVSGKFKIKVTRHGVQTHNLEFQNLILDRFITRWSQGFLTDTVQCVVGTGTALPEETDTNLSSQTGPAATGVPSVETNYKVGSNYFAATSYRFTFPLGSIIATIGEVGVSFGGISGGLVDTKTLIKDLAGDATTIELTAEDQLVIEYTMTQKLPLNAAGTVISINSVPTTCTVEFTNILNTNVWNIWTSINSLYDTKMYLYASETLLNNQEASRYPNSGFLVTVAGVSSTTAGPDAREVIYPLNFSQGNIPGGVFNYVLFTKTVSSVEYSTIGIHFSPAVPKTSDISLTIKIKFAIARM